MFRLFNVSSILNHDIITSLILLVVVAFLIVLTWSRGLIWWGGKGRQSNLRQQSIWIFARISSDQYCSDIRCIVCIFYAFDGCNTWLHTIQAWSRHCVCSVDGGDTRSTSFHSSVNMVCHGYIASNCRFYLSNTSIGNICIFLELASEVGERTMTIFSSKMTLLQFSSQESFLILISALAIALKLNDMLTAQVSQAINCVRKFTQW